MYLFIISWYRKDVSLPQQLQRAMATEAEASREGKYQQIFEFDYQNVVFLHF